MAKYVVVDDDNGAGCLTASIVSIVVIVVLAYLAIYALAIALGIIMIISGIVGTVLTIKNYVVALRYCISNYRHCNKPLNMHIPLFAYRWFKIVWETIKNSWHHNISTIANFWGKVKYYRFLSFKKWICLFTGLSVLIFGSLASGIIVFLHLYVLSIIIAALLALAVVLCVVFGIIGIGVSIAFATTNYITCVSDSYNVMAMALPTYILKKGFGEYRNIIINYWKQNITKTRASFCGLKGQLPFSVKIWIDFWTGLILTVTGAVLFLPFAILHLLLLSILFVVFKLMAVLGH